MVFIFILVLHIVTGNKGSFYKMADTKLAGYQIVETHVMQAILNCISKCNRLAYCNKFATDIGFKPSKTFECYILQIKDGGKTPLIKTFNLITVRFLLSFFLQQVVFFYYLYPLKTLGNETFSDIFMGYKDVTIDLNG